MARAWVRASCKNFLMLIFFVFLTGLMRRPSDLIWVALITLAGTWIEIAAPLTNPSPRALKGLAWLPTGITLFLLTLTLSVSARVAFWHVIGGVYRSGAVWAVAAGGWALLATVAWWRVITFGRGERKQRRKYGLRRVRANRT